MDTSIALANRIQKKDKQNIEAAFFLAAAHGFKGRLFSERGSWTKAAIEGKSSLTNMQITGQNDTLSPEFLFGIGLFNYYSVWIPENYKFLRPVMSLFPKGSKEKGMKQLKEVAFNAFYTRTEAQLYLARIYANEENQPQNALPLCEYLANTFPDNPYFQRLYARICYSMGKTAELEKVSLDILDKINRQFPGYEPTSGRYASYYLGYLYRNSYKKDKVKSRQYFDLCLQFCNKNKAFETGYYFYTLQNLMQLCEEEKNLMLAVEYASKLTDAAPKNHECHKNAKALLKKYPKEAKASRAGKGFWSIFGF
jgi:predicted Zn-dependent protease